MPSLLLPEVANLGCSFATSISVPAAFMVCCALAMSMYRAQLHVTSSFAWKPLQSNVVIYRGARPREAVG